MGVSPFCAEICESLPDLDHEVVPSFQNVFFSVTSCFSLSHPFSLPHPHLPSTCTDRGKMAIHVLSEDLGARIPEALMADRTKYKDLVTCSSP